MSNIEQILPKNVKIRQYMVAGAVAVASIGLISAWVLLGKKPTVAIDLEKAKRIEISKLTKGVKAEDRWLQQAEGELIALKKKIEIQDQEKKALEEKISNIQEEISKDEENPNQDNVLAEEILKLREEIDFLRNNITKANQQPQHQDQLVGIRKIKNTELKLDNDKSSSFDLKHYIPAGSFAPAVVISGVDASVGINSQSDPRPTLFRITGYAKTAAFSGTVQEVDLTGCTVTGAASGDLSSEKVFIRLLKMTCSREEGKVTETQVNGYVAGIGKGGVRGQVVSREGDFVMKSFLAGVASGLGSGAAQSLAAPMAITGGGLASTSTPGIKDILGTGAGKGIENSANRMSNYLIQRAEQYQPVISMPAGLDVTLLFNDGVYLDGKSHITDEGSQNVQN